MAICTWLLIGLAIDAGDIRWQTVLKESNTATKVLAMVGSRVASARVIQKTIRACAPSPALRFRPGDAQSRDDGVVDDQGGHDGGEMAEHSPVEGTVVQGDAHRGSHPSGGLGDDPGFHPVGQGRAGLPGRCPGATSPPGRIPPLAPPRRGVWYPATEEHIQARLG